MTPGLASGEIPNFEGTKKGLMIMLVGLIIQLAGPFMAIASPFVSDVIRFAGTAIILLGMFMIFFAIKRGEISIPDTTKMVNLSIILVVVGLVMYGIGFIFSLSAQDAMSEYDESTDPDEEVDNLKTYIDMLLLGGILTFLGQMLAFMAPALTMLGVRKVCFDEYQGKIMTKAVIAIILMVIVMFTVVGSLLIVRAAIYELDENSSDEDISDAAEALVNLFGAICIGGILFLIAYIFIIWATTTTFHGLKQVEGEHKRRMAGW